MNSFSDIVNVGESPQKLGILRLFSDDSAVGHSRDATDPDE